MAPQHETVPARSRRTRGTDGTVLVLCPPDDVHGRAVQGILRDRGIPCETAEVRFGEDGWRVAWTCGDHDAGAGPSDFAVQTDAGVLRAADLRSIWFRRYGWRGQPAPEADEVDRWLTRSEGRHLLTGITLTSSGPRLVNDPARELVARNKLVQLRIAASVGLRVPRSWIGNDPEGARRFADAEWAHGGRVITKVLEAPPSEAVFARSVEREHLDRLELIRRCPAVLQEFVDGGDLRVSVVGQRVFAARIRGREEACREDWRKEYFPEICAIELPDEVVRGIRRLMRRLGLEMGMLDFKERSSGELVFLEVNTQGQFLFVEVQTGQPITLAVAEQLAGRPLPG